MARNWTQKHIEELIEEVAIREGYSSGGSGDDVDIAIQQIIGQGIDTIFAAGPGAPTVKLTRTNYAEFEIEVRMTQYGSVEAGDTFFFIPNIGRPPVVVRNPLYRPVFQLFGAKSKGNTYVSEEYRFVDKNKIDYPVRGLTTFSIQGNNLYGGPLLAGGVNGWHAEATEAFSWAAFNLPVIKIRITVP